MCDDKQRETPENEGWYRIVIPWRGVSDRSLWPPAPEPEKVPPRE